MSYDYNRERSGLFTDEGQRDFLKVRDAVQKHCAQAGAMMSGKVLGLASSTWQGMACLDRMVELGEIREITGPDVFGQNRVFVAVSRDA